MQRQLTVVVYYDDGSPPAKWQREALHAGYARRSMEALIGVFGPNLVAIDDGTMHAGPLYEELVARVEELKKP